MNQFTTLRHRLQIFRSQFTAALRAMDYERALTCQVQIDELQRELDTLDPHRRLMARQHRDYAAQPDAPSEKTARGARRRVRDAADCSAFGQGVSLRQFRVSSLNAEGADQ